ncbi:MAG: DUF1833 family protein [Parvibaculaceae bacterium]|nr:DUF1833 family protein [Parvibaculaceae bacterium]
MIDPFDDAIREAYASAPKGVVVLRTLEFWHPSFDVPARVVRDHGVLLSEEPLVFGRELTLEGDAPRNPGETVTFIEAAFNSEQPATSDDTIPDFPLSVDGVPGDLAAALRASTLDPGEIEVIYREYFADAPGGPQYVLRDLTLKRTSVTMLRVEARAGFFDPLSISYPRTEYTADEYPSLAV